MSHINADLCETHIVGGNTREYIVSPQTCQALSLYEIRLVGLSYALPDFRFVRLQPTHSQLLVCLSGEGSVLVDGRWEQCCAGKAYLTPTNSLHAYYAFSESVWKLCWVMYEPHVLERLLPSFHVPILFDVEPQELAIAIEGLHREAMGRAELAIMHPWAQLVHRYAQRMIGQVGSDMRLQHLWDIVHAHLAYPWNNEELARRVGISSEHLRRLCQQQVGHSPMRHVTSIRMRRAMSLLASDSYNVTSVAREVGYENPFAFSTAFKKWVGVAPSMYRQKAQKTS